MRFNKTHCSLILAAISAIAPTAYAALSVTPGVSANDLADALIGPGVTRIGDAVYVGDIVSSGTFSNGLSVGSGRIGLDTGIVLTTGLASVAANATNTSDGTGGLERESTSLSFTFTSVDNFVMFRYVFASEEYNQYVGDIFNDTFALRVDGTNIAFVPGTSTPVAINSVNNNTNSAYYIDNDFSDFGGSPPYGFEYNGFTTVLTASLSLSPGEHEIEFFVTDIGDLQLDSAVFLGAGSLVPEPSSALLGCMGLLGLLRRRR